MTTLKKILLSLSCVMVFAFSVCGKEPTKVERNGWLKVEGTKMVNEKGEPISLKGASMGWHCLWPRFYNPGTVTRLAQDWNADVVRCAVGLDLTDISLDKDPELAYAVVDSIVKGAVDNGIYALVDFHSHANNLPLAKEFFDNVSKKYGNVPNVMYEIWNEPVDADWNEIKEYATELIPVIRKNAPNAIIVVPTPRWDQEVDKAAADPLKIDNNIVYALHFYAATHTDWLRERAQKAIDSGLPIYISECAAMEATGDGPMDLDSWNKWTEFADRNGIGWIAWSVSDKHETCSMLQPKASSDGRNWKESDLKEWGRIVRESLKR